jgi:hypothetical protein
MAQKRPLVVAAGRLAELASGDSLPCVIGKTRAQLDSLAAASALTVGELYWISDESRLAVAAAANAYTVQINESNLGLMHAVAKNLFMP